MGNKNGISSFFHCKKCLSGNLAVGWTKEGLQVFCEDCNLNVIDIDFQGQKVMLVNRDVPKQEGVKDDN